MVQPSVGPEKNTPHAGVGVGQASGKTKNINYTWRSQSIEHRTKANTTRGGGSQADPPPPQTKSRGNAIIPYVLGQAVGRGSKHHACMGPSIVHRSPLTIFLEQTDIRAPHPPHPHALTADRRQRQRREAVAAERVNRRVRRVSQAKPQGVQHPLGRHLRPGATGRAGAGVSTVKQGASWGGCACLHQERDG